LVGVGVNVKDVPAQLGLVPVVIAIDTAGVTDAVLLMVMLPDVAVAEVTQAALDVITQLTTSEFARAALVKVAPVAVFVPFTLH
jgi:hypothetical protein